MKGVTEFKEALESKSLTALTKALSEIADQLAYQLKPPYTEILDFRAREQSGRFSVHFSAKLYLHYSSLASQVEGLLFIIQFGGDALSDTPTPPSDELFYAGSGGILQSSRIRFQVDWPDDNCERGSREEPGSSVKSARRYRR